ncbi:hypothetical protein F511_18702 [Dorcoceras hygrometricum]|uniref:Uncharacterized protein n=1 Tax=Dorcoceras hygrometricum TaxID=472368 RepID=A0A2Z7BVP2_9LAMI|nr:hypothetical protein F511_18702 [Dorcoceras hygrometricum]
MDEAGQQSALPVRSFWSWLMQIGLWLFYEVQGVLRSLGSIGGCIGPRPDAILLRQPALEGLTRSARMDSPRKVGRNDFPAKRAVAAACEKRGGAVQFRLGLGF